MVNLARKRRKFGGFGFFRLVNTRAPFTRKRQAQSRARFHRRRGFLARVVQDSQGFWNVYIRKRTA